MAMGIASLFLAMTQVSHAGTMVYVSNADSQDVSVFELDRSAGALKPVDTTALGGMAMPMAVSRDSSALRAAMPLSAHGPQLTESTGNLRLARYWATPSRNALPAA